MSIIDAATTTTSSFVNTVVSYVGLATGISNTISRIFTNVTLPMANPLSSYATYNYVLSIGVLSTADLNNPEGTYMAGKRIPLLCKTAGADPNNRVNTPFGKFEFYIENLVLDSVIGLVANKNTNVATMEFDIIEPYSMGMFMVALQQASLDQGYTNWRETPLLMTISFQGNQQNGTLTNISNTTRYIPFKLGEMTMKTTERGTTYHFTAYAHNTAALTEEKAGLKSDASVKGKTVQEMLQTGEKSLQVVVNQRLKQYKEDGIVDVPDEVLILFPIDQASSASGAPVDAESTASATTNVSASGADLYKKLGVVRSSSTQNLVQDNGQCNLLGRASMGYNLEKKADPVMSKDNKVYDEKSTTWDQSQNTVDLEEGNLKFTQDTDIPSVINQVLLASNYPNYLLSSEAVDKEGMRPVWKIDTQVYDIESDANLGKTGVRPKLIVYRVIPYAAHASHMSAPNVKPPGIDNLKKQAVKVYDYIYTGKNTEVLKFEIDFSYGFNNVFAADNFKRGQDVQLASKQAGAYLSGLLDSVIGGIFGDIGNTINSIASAFGGNLPIPNITGIVGAVTGLAGNSPSRDIGTIPTQASYRGTSTSTDGMGGGGLENAINRSARYFYDAFTSSNNMVMLDMEILGDPYWIAQSGISNYTSKQTQYNNLNADMTVNYQNGEVHVLVNFKTPIDINQATGLYDFGGGGNTAPVSYFSGLYTVNIVKSVFNHGRFTQTLTGYRVPQQENKKEGSLDQLFNIDSILSNVIGGIFK